MGAIGCGLSVLAVVLAVLTALPLLGWANWITTIPVALLAIIMSVVALNKQKQPSLAVGGLVIGVLTFCWAVFRLSLGGGFI